MINAHWSGVDAQANKYRLQQKNPGMAYSVVDYDPCTGPPPYGMTAEHEARFCEACKDMLLWKYGVENHDDAMRLSTQVNRAGLSPIPRTRSRPREPTLSLVKRFQVVVRGVRRT